MPHRNSDIPCVKDFLQVFDNPLLQEEAAQKLFTLQQGKEIVSKFAIHFRIIAEESSLGETVWRSAFINALNKQIKDQLATRDVPTDLDSLIALSIRIDNGIRVPVSLLEEDYNSQDHLVPGSAFSSPWRHLLNPN